MIKVKDYKAFHGVMKVTPKGMIVPIFELEADWLYIPDKKVWITNDIEYAEEICTVVSDDAEILQSEVRLLRGDNRNLQDLCNAEKAKVEKLNNKLIDIAKKLQTSKKLNKVLYEGIEKLINRLERHRNEGSE